MTTARPSARRRVLVSIEAATAVCAAAGGALLVAAPDGHLLSADPAVLAGSPFHSWRVPGVLLLTLVGGGFAAAAAAQATRWRGARALSIAAGLGLIAFETAEWVWLGPQPLEFAFMAVGAGVVGFAAAT